jgi:hypothetical protein
MMTKNSHDAVARPYEIEQYRGGCRDGYYPSLSTSWGYKMVEGVVLFVAPPTITLKTRLDQIMWRKAARNQS